MAGVSAAISSRERGKGQAVEPTPLDRAPDRFHAGAILSSNGHGLPGSR